MRLVDLTGTKFGRWSVISRGNNRRCPKGSITTNWLCRCECGNIKEVPSKYLKNGQSKSCGCYMKEKAVSDNTTHGLSNTGEYNNWLTMHQRCYNKNYSRYKDWGGRGIKICPEWHKDNQQGFLNFYRYVKELGTKTESSSTLDRLDNDGDYAPGNIKWSSKKQQRLNQQNTRIKFFSYGGEVLCMKDWAKKLFTSPSNIIYWLKKNKSFEWIYKYYMESNNEKS